MNPSHHEVKKVTIQNESEAIVTFYKRPLFQIFLKQFDSFIIYQTGFFIGSFFAALPIVIIQVALVLYLLYLIKAKYTKSNIGIEIDYQSQTIKIEQFSFFGKNKKTNVDFENFDTEKKGIWMSNYYGFAAILKEKNKTFAIIPIIGSIWNKAEIKSIMQEFEKVKAIKKEIVNALDMKTQDQKTEY
jgi:hypothetical protein